MKRVICLLGAIFLVAPCLPAQEPDGKRLYHATVKSAKAVRQMEFLQMLQVIVKKGANMGAGDGWFKPSESRYSWKSLAEQFDADKDGRITAKEFGGAQELFMRLDRNRDGAITASDLDWSDSSPFWKQQSQANTWMRTMTEEGKLSRDEWNKLFDKLAQGKNYLNADDIRALQNPPPKKPASGTASASSAMPSKDILLKGLFAGELGSLCEGPRLGQRAPDFTLVTHDGRRTITLSKFLQQKPVVLIFGSFT
jgi:Ca2+-binding EF-hand superfamily protein